MKTIRKGSIFSPVAFIDDNFLDPSNELFGIPVLTPSEAKRKIESNGRNHIIIITSNSISVKPLLSLLVGGKYFLFFLIA